MRQVPLPLLFAFALSAALAHAEEPVPSAPPLAPAVEPAPVVNPLAAELAQLTQRLAESERQREVLAAQLADRGNASEQDGAQLTRLRQENQRLKLQLREAQANRNPPLVSEEQMWFAVGGGACLFSLLAGALLRGGRRQPRQWIN